MKNMALSCGLVLVLVGCGSSQEQATTPLAAEMPEEDNPCAANPCAENPCAAGAGQASAMELPVDVSTWSSWTRMNDSAFLSKSHDKSMVDVFVNPEHAESYRSRPASMPVGMAIVKAQYKDENGSKGAATNLTVMVKMEPGFDPEHGDWYYGVYSHDGKSVKMEGKAAGKTASCAKCHEDAGTDYVFGLK